MKDTDRDELITAMHQMAVMVDGLLDLTERLAESLKSGDRPSPEQIDDLQDRAALWRQQHDRVRQRLASATVEPSNRVH